MDGTRAGSLPRPGPIGRGVRLVLGIVALWFGVGLALDLPELAHGLNLRNPLVWIGFGWLLWEAPELMKLVLGRRWSSRTTRLGLVALFALAGGAGLMAGSGFFGAPFSLTFGVLLGSGLTLLGVSFLLAAALAAPG